VRGKPWLEGHGEPPDPQNLAKPRFGPLSLEHMIYLGGILGVGVVYFLVQKTAAVGLLLALGFLL
jgi:POT family proton-dependent oligopeptide transporter